MSPLPILGPEGRISQRRRERASTCTQATPDTASEKRASGVSVGGRLTLEQLLDSVWEGLHAGGTAACPVCRGRMSRGAAGATARCEDCWTGLS